MRGGRYIGAKPWEAWTDNPSLMVREFFFDRAQIAESAEREVANMREQPSGQYAGLITEGRFASSKPSMQAPRKEDVN